MNYGEAKKFLLTKRPSDEDEQITRAERDAYYDNREIAMNVIVLSFAENAERAASALIRIADALEAK